MNFLIVLAGAVSLSPIQSSFVFEGGGDADLVKGLRNHFGGLFVLLASPNVRWGKVSFRADTQKDSERLLRTKLGITKSPLIGAAAPISWPEGLYRRSSFARYERSFKSIPLTDTFEDGKLTLRTQKEEALSLQDTLMLGMKKPLRLHRCLTGARFRVDVNDIDEPTFIKSLAAAVGGRIVERPQETFIDVDPAVFVARAINYWIIEQKAAERNRQLVEMTDAEYMVQLLHATPVSLVKKALDNPESDFGNSFAMGTPVFASAWKRVRAFLATPGSGKDGVQKLFEDVVDPDQPVIGLIDPHGNPRAAYYNRERNHRVHL